MNTSYDIVSALSEHPTSNVIAGIGSLAWLWLPYVQGLSKGAGIVLPILSVIWLGIQIYSWYKKQR